MIRVSIKNYLKNYFDFGLAINENKEIKVAKKNCLLPYPLAIGYAVSLAISGKVNSISFAGLDGYNKSQPEYDQTEEILHKFKKNYSYKKFKSLTKTKYKTLFYIKNEK